jgi:tRNA(Ile)-lysidine synthase
MALHGQVNGVLVLRPLLDVSPDSLRDELRRRGQSWREDASNASDDYRRNRFRKMLTTEPALVDDLVALAASCRTLVKWVARVSPDGPAALPVDAFDGLPPFVRANAARRWLVRVAGVPDERAGHAEAARLLAMMDDAASPARVDLAGGVRLQRRRGVITALKVAFSVP